MKTSNSGHKISQIAIYVFTVLLALSCLLPMINQLAISFSSSGAVATGMVTFLPTDVTLASYKFVVSKPEFYTSLLVSLERIAIAVPLNMLITVLAAYPLSRDNRNFRSRKYYVWYIVVTMLFSGGLIPWYMTAKYTGIIDTIWALILPSSVPVFNIILLMNFFRTVPKELEEAAIIDGASHFRILIRIIIPISMPAIATLVLFCIVAHWNSWFEGLILMNDPKHYPLQSYLQTVIVAKDTALMTETDMRVLSQVSDRTSKAAQIFIAALPVLAVYPFLQKYFTTGIVMGSVKG